MDTVTNAVEHKNQIVSYWQNGFRGGEGESE